MKIPSINNQNISFPDRINAIDIIMKTYPDVTPYFFMEKPNIYDQKYISGITREQSVFKVNDTLIKKQNSLIICNVCIQTLTLILKPSPGMKPTPLKEVG